MSATASLQKKWNQLCNVIWDDPEAKQVERTAGKEAGEQDKKRRGRHPMCCRKIRMQATDS